MRRVALVAVLGLFVLALTVRDSAADQIRIAFKGHVTEIENDTIGLGPNYGIQIGTEVIGSITWDTNAFLGEDPTLNSYQRQNNEPFISVFMKLGSATVDYTADTIEFFQNTVLFRGDNAINASSNPYPEWADLQLFPWIFQDLPSLYELTQDFNTSLFSGGSISIGQEVRPLQTFKYEGEITSVRQVPEPATWMLLGLAAVAAVRRQSIRS